MATISVIDTVHTRVQLSIDELQADAAECDKLVFKFSQNGTQILAYTYDFAPGESPGFSFTFTFLNESYLGNNYFSPATTYSITVDHYAGGAAYPIGPVTFTTDSVSPPSGSIAPAVYPTVKNQGEYGNCVAMSLSTAMEIFKAKAMGAGASYENFSVSYIFGSDGASYDWMTFVDAVELCKAHGSPRWELVTQAFPDSKSKSDSNGIFTKATPLANGNAQKQAFTGSANIDFYDCYSVASAIRNYGYFMMNFRIPKNFYSIPSTGIVPQPSGGYSGSNHSIALIGLTSQNGKPHWIAQNSWGTSWGQGGLCYIPYDWGCGAQSPQGANNKDQACGWTTECYTVWNSNIQTSNPNTAKISSAAQVGITQNANITWAHQTQLSSLLLYARKKGTLDWWPKPGYGNAFQGNDGQISFDKTAAVYEIMSIAVKDDLLSPQSSIVTVSISFVTPWSWNYSNGIATSSQTISAHSALVNNGPLSNFSYLVWNDLVNKANEAAIASGDSWLGATTLFDTRMTEYDKALTARRYNALRTNVASKAMPAVSSGDPVKGSYFITMAEKLNTWIGTL